MLNEIDEAAVHCPYCGEPLTLLVDASVAEQCYYEDCAVCCRPILVSLQPGLDGGVQVTVAREDD